MKNPKDTKPLSVEPPKSEIRRTGATDKFYKENKIEYKRPKSEYVDIVKKLYGVQAD